MVVGVLRFVLSIPGAGSLKGKRQVLRRVIERIRARFPVAVAEVADHDAWQKATVGVAAVSNDRAFLNELLDKVLRSVEESGADGYVVAHELELIGLGAGLGRSGAGERTLAEAEAGVGAQGALPDYTGEALPSLEELEEAAERYHAAPPAAPPRKRRK